jgi:hypothetical protein
VIVPSGFIVNGPFGVESKLLVWAGFQLLLELHLGIIVKYTWCVCPGNTLDYLFTATIFGLHSKM